VTEPAGTGILFLCVANSSRSQMAEGFARERAPEGVEIYSAGSAPTAVNPLAVQVMRELGIDLSAHRSKAIAEIPADRIGTVVTLCAEEVCPVFPGEVKRLHWPMPDPAAAEGSDEERADAFRAVREMIRRQVTILMRYEA